MTELRPQAHIARRNSMPRDDDFHVRLGRIRSRRAQRARPFIAQALAAAEKAGGRHRRDTSSSRRNSTFGRGRAASLSAARLLRDRSRKVTIKARIVRQATKGAALSAHLSYLRRDGVTKDGAAGRMFDADWQEADHRAFAERCEGDRHHFRFIVSPEDAKELGDLKAFTRDLMGQAERDLGTTLDWVAVDHWNTEHPHIHVIVRGKAEDGQDLVIARDYISRGMRSRAQELLTQELGPRTDLEIRQSLDREVEAERWTGLDRAFAREAGSNGGIIDLRPQPSSEADELRLLKVARVRKLEELGAAQEIAPGKWTLADHAEKTLRELGQRDDVIKRLAQGLAATGVDRDTGSFVLAGESLDQPIIGRLVARGLDDELRGTGYAIVDGVDGRVHHIRLRDLDAAGDGMPGAIVELRRFDDSRGHQRVALAVRSDLPIEEQISTAGATWLDRQLVSRQPATLSESGFGAEAHQALEARGDHLVGEGLARRQGRRLVLIRNLIETLRRRNLEEASARLSAETGLPHRQAAAGERVSGTYRHRLSLASGRFAMIDDGLGFTLVPWTPSMEKHLRQEVSGMVRADGGIDWSFSRKRGLGLGQ
jgi:type IV secretory pathway VirD2 relaxase